MRSRNPETMKKIQDYVDDFSLMYHRSPSAGEIARGLNMITSTVYRYLVDMNELGMIRYDGSKKEIVTDKTSKGETDFTKAAVLGSVSCGIPLLEEAYAESYVTLPVSIFGKGEFYLLRANGDSMIGAGINDGDVVVIRRQSTAENGDIVVALVDGANTLKTFYYNSEDGRIHLHPENDSMQDIIVDECGIQGVAVHVIKELKNQTRGR